MRSLERYGSFAEGPGRFGHCLGRLGRSNCAAEGLMTGGCNVEEKGKCDRDEERLGKG